jgi:hypothetical protein
MTTALPLISRDEYDENGSLNESANTFSAITTILLNESQKTHNDMYCMNLDLLLRKIAVLDASLFDEAIRNFLNKPDIKNRAYDDPVIITLSQLMDHCDILMKFDK